MGNNQLDPNLLPQSLLILEIGGGCIGIPKPGQLLLGMVATRPFILPKDLVGSKCVVLSPPDGSAMLPIKVNGVAMGDVLIAAGATEATFSFTSEVLVEVGDILTVQSHPAPHESLTDILLTMQGRLVV